MNIVYLPREQFGSNAAPGIHLHTPSNDLLNYYMSKGRDDGHETIFIYTDTKINNQIVE